jgi:hypothetical protein
VTTGLLVHAVVPTAEVDALDLDAIADGGARVDAVRGEQVAAIVTAVDGEIVPSRRALLQHAGIVERTAAATPVLPMRFGVSAPSADALLADVLHPRGSELAAQVDRLTGCDELRLRATYAEEAVIRIVLQHDRRAAALRNRRGTDARIELGERIVAGIEQRRDVDADEAVATLRPHVLDVVRDPVGQPLAAFALSFLVHRDSRSGFEAALDAYGEASAPLLSLELVGPMPPYSFTSDGP